MDLTTQAMDHAAGGPKPVQVRPPINRALLIGSSYKGLPGTKNDVETMARILERYGFNIQKDVTKLCDADATRDNILHEWKELASEDTKAGDVVVIYYSGHGGLAERLEEEKDAQKDVQSSEKQPNRIQFLVPSDFDPTVKEWQGIMDMEISLLLRKITARTQNVTYILDCCHSARLGRGPGGVGPPPEAKFQKFDYGLILEQVKRLRKENLLLEDEYWINQDVVRIAAAGDRDSAWQYRNTEGRDVGIMTEKLEAVMKNPGSDLSWRSIMLGVKALVEREFPLSEVALQQPRSAGADVRVPFQLTRRDSRGLLAAIRDQNTLIEGGRVHGVHVGDAYKLIPFFLRDEAEASTAPATSDTPQDGEPQPPAMITTATISRVTGFTALSLDVTATDFPTQLAIALPLQRNPPWPVLFPANLTSVKEFLDGSNFFKPVENSEKPIVEFRRDGENIVLFGRKQDQADGQDPLRVQLGSRKVNDPSSVEKLFSAAYLFAQAQDIASLTGGEEEEEFCPDMEIDLGVIRGIETKSLAKHKNDMTTPTPPVNFTVGDRYYARIKYVCQRGDKRVYVSLLHVDAAGNTILVTSDWESGVDLSFDLKTRVLAKEWSAAREGILISWPESVEPPPQEPAIEGFFIFVITRQPIDLRSLEVSSSPEFLIPRGEPASFVASRNTTNPFHVIRIPYLLQRVEKHQRYGMIGAGERGELSQELVPPVVASALTADDRERFTRDSIDPRASKGLGQFIRFLQRIPPFVWVINQYDEDIYVVVKKFSEIRKVKSVGIDAGMTSGGANLEFATFATENPTKKIVPESRDPNNSMASFPLWTRHDGYGVISIYKDADMKEWHILSDHVKMGARVYFKGGPNLIYND